MSLIVDASIVVRWYVPEAGADAAERILASSSPLIAPELVIAEAGNALWKRVRRGELSGSKAVEIIGRVPTAFTLLTPLSELAGSAMTLSAEFDHPIYDCFYLALALRENVPVVTADKRFRALSQQAGVTATLLS